MSIYHKIKEEIFNPYISYEANNKNGCDLPEKEGCPVIIYDSDKPRYFIGRIAWNNEKNKIVAYDSFGRLYGSVTYLYWAPFKYFDE